MLLIAFTRPDFYADEARQLAELLPFLDGIQIRKEETANEGKWRKLLQKLPEDQLSKIWIHDHYELCTEFPLGGIHITQEALSHNKALNVFAGLHNTKSSITVRTLEEAREADALYDRLFISPVYPSISKARVVPKISLETWRKFLEQPREAQSIALGGISARNISQTKGIGFDGAAVLGSLWNTQRITDHGSLKTVVKSFYQLCHQRTLS